MDKFGFIVHPADMQQLKNICPKARVLPNFFIKWAMKYFKPFILSEVKNIRSKNGEEVRGYLIGCPLLPDQMLKLDEEFVLDKIITAGKIAETLGVKIIGLGGYTSIVGDKGYSIAKNLKIPVTSGNSLTAWAVIESILKISNKKNITVKNSTLAVIGASGSIGSLCTKQLSYYFPKIIITARHREKLEHLKCEVLKLNPI